MKFDKIIIENFGVYNGRNVVDFDLPPTKNICLVDGNNGWGKTTFQNAIRYCLYGVKSNQSERIENINRRAKNSGSPHMMVQIQFTHREKNYQVTRSVEMDKLGRPEESLTVLVNGTPTKAPNAVIEEVLPKDASQFFFFDGTDIKRYTHLDNAKGTREAIELVLGIPAIRNSIEHMTKIHSKKDKELVKEEKKDQNLKGLADEIEVATKEIDDHREKVKKLEGALRALDESREAVERELQKDKAAEGILDKIEDNKKGKARISEKLEELDKQTKEDLIKLPFAIILPDLEKTRTGFGSELARVQDKVQERNRVEGAISVLETLKLGDDCFCGTKVGKPELVFVKQNLQNFRDRLGNLKSVGDFDLVTLQKLDRAIGRVTSMVTDLPGLERKRAELTKDLDELQAENKSYEGKLGTISREDIKKLTGKRDEIIEEAAAARTDLEWHSGAIKNKTEIRDKKRRDLSELAPATPQMKHISNEAELAGRVERALQEYLDLTAKQKRKQIEEETSAVHGKLTNKPKVYSGVKINEDYTFGIVAADGEVVPNEDISMGEREILALSFIAGLNRSTEKEAPVVMDTPFGNLDLEHKEKVLEFLPNLGTQVVLLSTDRDIDQNDLKKISGHIGKRMEIVFDMATKSSTIHEVV